MLSESVAKKLTSKHYGLNQIESKKTEALNVWSNSTQKSKKIFNKIWRCKIEPENKSISSAKKRRPIGAK